MSQDHFPTHRNAKDWVINRAKLKDVLEDEAMVEQVYFSLAAIKQLERLPAEIAQYHIAFLTYAGIVQEQKEDVH